MLSQWHFWSAFFGTGALLVLLAWLGSRRRKLSPKQIAAGGYPAACGSCAYDLTGLPGHICPECGSDLDLVGRLSPRFHRWQSVPVTARLIVWTVVVGCFASGMIVMGHDLGIGRLQRFDAKIERYVREPLALTSPGKAPLDYSALTLTVSARFVRPAPPDDWMISGYGTIMPRKATRWTGAVIEVHRAQRPTVTDDGEGYYWPNPNARVIGTGLVYLEPDEQGRPMISELSSDTTGLSHDADTVAALSHAIKESGYGGQYGTVEALAASIAPSVDSFLANGAPVNAERPSAWSPRYGGMATAYASNVQPPEFVAAYPAALDALSLLFWLLGLPFVLRKRPMSIRHEVAADGAREGATAFAE